MTSKEEKPTLEDNAIELLTTGLSLEDLRQSARDRGLNPEAISARYNGLVARMRKACRDEKLQKAEVERLASASLVRESASQYLDWSRERLFELIQCLSAKPQVHAFFRDLDIDSMTDDDLRDLIAQIDAEGL